MSNSRFGRKKALQSLKNKIKYVYSHISSGKVRNNKVKEFAPSVRGLIQKYHKLFSFSFGQYRTLKSARLSVIILEDRRQLTYFACLSFEKDPRKTN